MDAEHISSHEAKPIPPCPEEAFTYDEVCAIAREGIRAVSSTGTFNSNEARLAEQARRLMLFRDEAAVLFREMARDTRPAPYFASVAYHRAVDALGRTGADVAGLVAQTIEGEVTDAD